MIQFPKHFWWGAATSSYQVEGNNSAADWWMWEKAAGKENSGQACHHYELYNEDFDLVKNLNHNAHRLSIEWSRIEPQEGQFNQKEIQHYIRVINALRSRGIEPMVTLHHFTNPIWLSEKGGWTNPDVIKYFNRYCDVMVQALAKKVNYWMTINEPTIYISHSYLFGFWPPQEKSLIRAKIVHDHMLAAHTDAYRVIHRIYKGLGLTVPQVGIAPHMPAVETHQPTLFNKVRVWFRDFLFNFEILDQLYKAKTMDFIGINYYSRNIVGKTIHAPSGKNSLSWDIYPQGLYDILLKLKKYKLPVIISENGICTADDTKRWDFIAEHLKAIHQAMAQGVDVRGYLYWSLLDNFEWDKGFDPRFGLIDVDYKTFKRHVRESARKFAKVCEGGCLDI